ncbi:inositol monophosphatase family protein [Cytobacillus spongiae]|uniref:inositol monophosphatase family protein n=1 Tax=Cytobacillus spongiae TaxID=2901381 RepID=UPI001F26ED77|nr:inositol monophosphatase family protein [Cytobacillus spongiae]UII57259.1 inositol monophosphatase family protein [Cytobacillus spongiae]
MTNWNEVDTYAKEWIKEAGESIKKSFVQKITVESKSNPNDLVTDIDKATEKFFIHKINERFPTHQILGEEGFGNELEELSGTVWIIDPIDGTMNFVHQQRNFAISIGIYEDGVGMIGLIYDVVHDELYHAMKDKGAYLNDQPLPKLTNVKVEEAIIGLNTTWVVPNRRIDHSILTPLVRDVRGTRSYGSAALEIAFVATGRLDAYITLRLSPWDFAGGIVIIEELGGVYTTLNGKPFNLLGQNSVLISRPGLHERILKDYLNNGIW